MGKCFREMPIIPPAEEFLWGDGAGKSCLPFNKVGEAYQDTYSYLDTHFRLLREDLLDAYRQPLKELRSCEWNGKGSYDSQLYMSVQYLGMRAGRMGIEYDVSFDLGGERVDWERSKLLMNNSLLCISHDGFLTFFWATVCNRDRIEEYVVSIKPINDHDDLSLQRGISYCMFESTRAYYEAYLHPLRVLQNPAMEHIQFIEQLVYLEPIVPELELCIDWKRVRKCDSLDPSQEAAINHGLNKKLAIIQGPPGTGKTFTGLLIVKALLRKVKISGGPILVVCYTNRALDQFLEGIYAYENSLARLGSRSQSAVLSKRTLDQIMKKRTKSRKKSVVPKETYETLQQATKEMKKLEKIIRYNCLKGFRSREEWSNLRYQYSGACNRVQEARRNVHICVLGKLKVVGMTSTFAARNHELVLGLKSEIMVVEEAAELLEANILGCLNPSIRHLILIGDHMQLKPSVSCPRLGNKHKLDVSMFERLVTSGVEFKTLEVQRRMRSAISRPLVTCFYPMLRDHPCVNEFGNVKGVKENVFFIDHCNPEDPAWSGSRSNAWEADMVVEFCFYLTNSCGYRARDITILSMYRSQAEKIMKAVSTLYSIPGNYVYAIKKWVDGKKIVNPEDYVPKVRSVDEFQGEENNIILLSLVRNVNSNSSEVGQRSIGFLNMPNRICVALSRARIGLYTFGNADLLSDCCQVWRDIIQQLRENGCVGNGIALCCTRHPEKRGIVAHSAQELRNYNEGQKNFCTAICKKKLNCGHSCTRKCHYGGHEDFKCQAKCMNTFEACGHVCNKKCHAHSNAKECFPCLQCKRTKL